MLTVVDINTLIAAIVTQNDEKKIFKKAGLPF